MNTSLAEVKRGFTNHVGSTDLFFADGEALGGDVAGQHGEHGVAGQHGAFSYSN